jgi:hypothetical protein
LSYLLLTSLVAIAGISSLWLGDAWAVTKSWDAGCGANTNWSCAANWSDDVVPVSGDTVNFSSGSTNSVVDASFAGTVTNMTISGYTGTISLARSLTVSTAFTQSSGTFTAGSQSLIMGTLTINSGSNFTASSGTTTINGATSINSGATFSANGGTVDFSGSVAGNIGCGNKSFNLVTYTKTYIGTVSIGSDCSLPLGNNPNLGSSGTLSLSGTLSGTGTLTRGAILTLASGSSLSGFTGLNQTAGLLTVSAAYNFGSYTTFNAAGGLTVGAVSLTAPSGTATIGGNFTLASGTTFNANGGTLDFNGSASMVLDCFSKTFNAVTFANRTGTTTVNSNCTLPVGASPNLGASGTFTLNGTLSGSGTLSKTGGTLTLGNGGALTGFTGLSVVTLNVNGTYNFGAYTTFAVGSNFSANAVTSNFTAPSGTATIGGGITLGNSSTFNANGGTLDFNGNITANFLCANKSFNLVTISKPSGIIIIDDTCNLPLGNNPTIPSTSSLTLNGTLSGTGTLTRTGGPLTLASGGNLSGFTGLSAAALTIAGTYNFGLYTTFAVSGAFQLQSGGNMTAPSSTASFGAGFTIASGVPFNANGGTVNFTAGSTSSITCNGAVFNLVTFTNGAIGKTVASSCTLPIGNNPTIGRIVLNGTLTGSGTITTANAQQLGATGALVGFTGYVTDPSSVIVSGNYNFSNYTTFSIAGSFTLDSGGTFTAPSGNASFASSFTLNAGTTFNANGGTVTFNPSNVGGYYTIACNNAVFNLVKIQRTSSGTTSVSSDCNLPLGNNPVMISAGNMVIAGTLSGSGILSLSSDFGLIRIDSGTGLPFNGFSGLKLRSMQITTSFNASNFAPFTIAGNLEVKPGGTFIAPLGTLHVTQNITVESGGAFTHNNGGVMFDGPTSVITGGMTFNDLSMVGAGSTLAFAAGSTTTVLGNLTLQGASSGRMVLSSTVPGSPWYLDANGAANIDYVSVSDSVNTSETIGVCNSVDGGGNTGWIFNPSACSPNHGTAADATISNYQFVQAAGLAAEQAAQDQNGDVLGAWLNGLPFGASQFGNSFPAGRPIISGVANFAGAVVVSLLGLALIGSAVYRFWLYIQRRRRA